MDENKLAENNLTAQLSLMNDIISNNKSINFHIVESGKKVMEILRERKLVDKEKLVTFTKEQYDEMFNLVFALTSENNFYKLGILAEKAVPDNELKFKILAMLKKS